jgi:hypothetical protein
MSIEQTTEILDMIAGFYPSFTITEKMIKSWHMILSKHNFDEVKELLLEYIETSENKRFPPTVGEIVPQKVRGWGK